MATSIIINNESVKLTGIQEPNDKYKEKYILEGHANNTEYQFNLIYYPPEKIR
mgnify:CR=1 FL=1